MNGKESLLFFNLKKIKNLRLEAKKVEINIDGICELIFEYDIFAKDYIKLFTSLIPKIYLFCCKKLEYQNYFFEKLAKNFSQRKLKIHDFIQPNYFVIKSLQELCKVFF